MGQVAFDTQEFVETLENAGLPKDQAKAISLVVRKSHEVADLATKRDLDDVRKDLSADIAEVKREIADVRKDMSAGFDKINDKFEKLGMQMTIRLGLMVAAAVSIIAAILKM
ncbi:DUF1640 domain-containing protein [Symbiopectobacterium purcellii]|uniref:DUF1640 domain-containing protein n=1 Tax=Symbiopectobacterium purcellii TaxID=2871826 RepID=UPI003F878A7D